MLVICLVREAENDHTASIKIPTSLRFNKVVRIKFPVFPIERLRKRIFRLCFRFVHDEPICLLASRLASIVADKDVVLVYEIVLIGPTDTIFKKLHCY